MFMYLFIYLYIYIYICIFLFIICTYYSVLSISCIYTSLRCIFCIPTFGCNGALRVAPPLQVVAAPPPVQVGLDGIRSELGGFNLSMLTWDIIAIDSHIMWIMGCSEGYTSHYADITIQVMPNNGISLGYNLPISWEITSGLWYKSI